MSVLSPGDVERLLRADAAAQYIDVRTVAEFAQGRPLLRAINVPYVFHTPHNGAEVPNGSFTDIVSHLHARDARLVVGGDTDDRAERARAALVAAGFSAVALMSGGLGAWRDAQLPTTRDNRDGVSYVSLLTRFRRKDKRRGDKAAAH